MDSSNPLLRDAVATLRRAGRIERWSAAPGAGSAGARVVVASTVERVRPDEVTRRVLATFAEGAMPAPLTLLHGELSATGGMRSGVTASQSNLTERVDRARRVAGRNRTLTLRFA